MKAIGIGPIQDMDMQGQGPVSEKHVLQNEIGVTFQAEETFRNEGTRLSPISLLSCCYQ